MASPVIQNNFRVRKNFAKIAKIIDIPNLIDIQKQSYEKFLQKDIAAEQARGRRPAGRLQERLPDQGLLGDVVARVRLATHLEKPKYDVDECRQRGMTFAAPIKVDRPPGRLGHQRGDRRRSRSATSRSRRSTSARSR